MSSRTRDGVNRLSLIPRFLSAHARWAAVDGLIPHLRATSLWEVDACHAFTKSSADVRFMGANIRNPSVCVKSTY